MSRPPTTGATNGFNAGFDAPGASERTNRLQTIPATVMFIDIVDSIDLFARLGDQAAKELIDDFFNELAHLTVHHHGTVIKRVGDELMCSFLTPLAAFAAARDMQRLAEVLNQTRPQPVELRIGFHTGSVISAAGDLFGDTVNIASRVSSVATSGRILTTGQSMLQVPLHDAGAVRPWRRELLKGVSEPVELYEVLWATDSNEGEFSNTSLGNHAHLAFHQLVLHMQGMPYVIDAQRPLLTIGRHAANRVVVDDDGAFVSGHHAKIEYRGGVFVLTDTSLNGTYLSHDGNGFFRITLPFTLESSGKIILGYPPPHPKQIEATFEVI